MKENKYIKIQFINRADNKRPTTTMKTFLTLGLKLQALEKEKEKEKRIRRRNIL